MKKIRAVIIEDEPAGTKNLLSLIKEYHTDVDILSCVQTVRDAKNVLADKSVDLFFADIELLDGNIFEALEVVKLMPGQQIIFTTAYSEFGVNAFEYQAIHYLLKPISPDGLAKAMARYKEATQKPYVVGPNDKGQDSLQKFEQDKILLPTQNGATFINLHTIIRVQSANKYSIVFTSDKKQHIVSKPLLRFEELMTDKGFIRVHDSHIINIHQITTYKRGNGGEVVMSDDSHVPISSRRKEKLSEILRFTL